jgi:hypothetical protein
MAGSFGQRIFSKKPDFLPLFEIRGFGVLQQRTVIHLTERQRGRAREKCGGSILPIFFMSLFDRQDLLDNHQFFLFIDLIKNGIPWGNVEAVDDYPSF